MLQALIFISRDWIRLAPLFSGEMGKLPQILHKNVTGHHVERYCNQTAQHVIMEKYYYFERGTITVAH